MLLFFFLPLRTISCASTKSSRKYKTTLLRVANLGRDTFSLYAGCIFLLVRLSWWTNTVELYPDRSVEWPQADLKLIQCKPSSPQRQHILIARGLSSVSLLLMRHKWNLFLHQILLLPYFVATLHFCLGTIQPYLSASLTVRVGKYTQRR